MSSVRQIVARVTEMKQSARSIVLGFLWASSMGVQAQTLGEPNPVDRISNVVQFGLPADAKFVFCDDRDCPERTVKNFHTDPPRYGQLRQPGGRPMRRIGSDAELSHAKDPAAAPSDIVNQPSATRPGRKQAVVGERISP